MINKSTSGTILALSLFMIPFASYGEEQAVQSKNDAMTAPVQSMPVFPPSDNCTTSRPCRNVLGEVIDIEESYWIKQPNGNKLHIKASKDSKLEKLPKVGDKIAAQITSTGDLEAMTTIADFPKSTKLEEPSQTLGDMR